MAQTDAKEGLVSNLETSSTNVISFLEQGEVSIGKFPDSISSYHSDIIPSLSKFRQDIGDFLARPLDVLSFNIAGTTTPATSYTEYDIDNYLKLPIIANKIAGFQALSFTTRVRLVVNANPFLQGRLMLIWVPGTTSSCPLWGTRSLSFTTLTQFPRIEIDIGSQSTGILEIPFIYPSPYYPNPNGGGGYNGAKLGSFLLFNYGSMATGTGSSACNATLYVSLHNVDLSIPGAQSGRSGGSIKRGPRVTAKNPELSRDDVKPISGALEGLSFAASAVAKVPMISSIATPAAWVLESMADAAKSFGFSNPEVGVYSAPNNQVAYTNFCNSDVPSYHNSLSVTRSNTLVRTSYLKGNDEDELALLGIVSRPAYIGSYNWDRNATPGSTIMSLTHSPAVGDATISVLSSDVTFRTPLSYIATFFAYWRGSINYKFKLVKTKYHSGRLMVTYVPRGTGSAFVAANASASGLYNLRKIVDISDLTEFDITIPYMNIDPWATGALGTIQVTVVNELVAPDTVSSIIQFLVEVCAGSDTEFSVPNLNVGYYDVPARTLRPQSGLAETSPPNDPVTDETLGGSQMLRSSMLPAELCIGEKINSLRTLLKRPGLMATSTSQTNGSGTSPTLYNGAQAVSTVGGLDPAGIYSAKLFTTTDTNNVISYNRRVDFMDAYSAIVSCYYLNRGGINYKVFAANTAPGTYQTVSLLCRNQYSRSVPNRNSTSTVAGTACGNLVDTFSNGSMCTFTVPYYSDSMWTYTTFYPVSGDYTDTPLASQDYQRTARLLRTSSNVTGVVHTYRSVADDFDVGFFISTPPMVRMVGTVPKPVT